MTKTYPTQTAYAPARSFTPARSGLLQRKCACGGTPGPSGECEECRKKRQGTLQRRAFGPEPDEVPSIVHEALSSPGQLLDVKTREFMEPSFGQDFSQVGVHTDTKAAGSAKVSSLTGTLPSGTHATAQRTKISFQQTQDMEGEQEYIGEVLGTFQAPCNGFFGASACNPSSGNYEIQEIRDNCCSKPCTRRHEARHATDLGGCCWLLNDNIQYHMGDRDVLIDQFNSWMDSGARSWSECNAYSVSVQCARELMAANKCNGQPTQCCKELQLYLTEMQSQKTAYCENAPKDRPPCPFRPAPGPSP
jgi:Domain of unknown function (DUF4157)